MKLSLADIALEMSDTMDMTKKDAKMHLGEMVKVLTENLEAGHEINLPGFGKFRVKESAARTAKNPKTGEPVEIPAKKVVKFLPAKQLKERVAG